MPCGRRICSARGLLIWEAGFGVQLLALLAIIGGVCFSVVGLPVPLRNASVAPGGSFKSTGGLETAFTVAKRTPNCADDAHARRLREHHQHNLGSISLLKPVAALGPLAKRSFLLAEAPQMHWQRLKAAGQHHQHHWDSASPI